MKNGTDVPKPPSSLFIALLIVFHVLLVGFCTHSFLQHKRGIAASENWTETSCTVETSSVRDACHANGCHFASRVIVKYVTTTKASFVSQASRFGERAGFLTETEEEAREVMASYKPGESYPCWYNPANPGEVKLSQDTPDMLLDFGAVYFLAVSCLGTLGYFVVWRKEKREYEREMDIF